jgi:hypothetical protein
MDEVLENCSIRFSKDFRSLKQAISSLKEIMDDHIQEVQSRMVYPKGFEEPTSYICKIVSFVYS